jgi:hypothetical protein
LGVTTGQGAHAGFSSGTSVNLGGQPAFQILGGADGFTAEHRAWQTQDALDNALVLAQNRSPEAVTVSRENGAITVMLDGRRVATADANSAALENMTADQLADKWAQSIKSFLSDQTQTATYVATLVRDHQVQASVALSERTLFTPGGFTFPVTLTTALTCDTVKAGDAVEATVDRDVPLGHYAIAAGSVLTGAVIDDGNKNFGICFTSMRTPNGTVVAVNATVMDDFGIGTSAPHLVATQVIPAGSAIGFPYVECRVPSGIGIGALSDKERHLFAFRRESGLIAQGRPLNLVFETPTPVAVVLRSGML